MATVRALALCHNVTPCIEEDGTRAYQAASPDEIALVKFTESVGLTLHDRTARRIVLQDAAGRLDEFRVLNIFPFTSETKRMGIIVRHKRTGRIVFYMKGAESVMMKVLRNDVGDDWLQEVCFFFHP